MPNYIAFYKKKGQLEKALKMRNKQRKIYYNKYNFSEVGKRTHYTQEEIDLIIDNEMGTDRELAKYLNRSVQGIQTKRVRVLNKRTEKEALPFI